MEYCFPDTGFWNLSVSNIFLQATQFFWCNTLQPATGCPGPWSVFSQCLDLTLRVPCVHSLNCRCLVNLHMVISFSVFSFTEYVICYMFMEALYHFWLFNLWGKLWQDFYKSKVPIGREKLKSLQLYRIIILY